MLGAQICAKPNTTKQKDMTKSKYPKAALKGAALICISLATGAGLRAQSSTPPPASASAPLVVPTTSSASNSEAGAEQQNVTTLEKYTVSDVPVTEQVLPTVRPIGDVSGDDQSIIDIPRSVSSVNEAWMKDRMVKNAMDFGQFSPGVYSAAQYGIPGVPFIRGDLGTVYVDGQISQFSRNSTPPSFNGVEAMDIVKGPGSAVYGPQGEGAGGYVDLVMKQPYFDGFRGVIDTTLGYWASGHAYSNPEVSVDLGGPLSDKLAYRVSYLERWGDGYYNNLHDSTQDLYAALTFRATKDLKFEGWAQMYSDRTNENSGVNRVTQQFIDNGTYVAGPASPTEEGPNAFFGYSIANLGDPVGAYGSSPDGSFSTVDTATAHTVKLSREAALIGPNDTARSKLFQTQLKATLDLSPDSFLVNRSLFSLGRSNKFETYGYDEYVPRDESIQDRLEYHGAFDLGSVHNQIIAGGDFRFSWLISYQDFTTEPFSYYDLTQPASQIFYPGYTLEGKTWGGGASIPGAPGYSANAETPDAGGSSGNQWSYIYDTAAFIQDVVKLTDRLSFTPGFRYDHIDATDSSPPVIEDTINAFFTNYPLATPIYIPRGRSSPIMVDETGIVLASGEALGVHSAFQGYNVTGSKNDASYFGSLSYKVTDTTTAYFTYDRAEAILGTSNFGGINVNPVAANINATPVVVVPVAKQLQQALSALSTLYELGIKSSFLNNTLYGSIVGFQQTKLGVQINGATGLIKDQGVEVEAVYQPSKQWTFNGNFTYQNATEFGDGYFQETGNYLDSYNTDYKVNYGLYGTGIGAPNYATYNPPGNRMRAPGIPQVQANMFLVYTAPSGWGLGVGPQIQGRQYANDQETLHIPIETEWDGYLFYGQRTWSVRLNIKNILNKRLLDPIDVSFAGNDVIFVRPPITASVTVQFKF
jgi:outer membrane receptor protein involved in Fe transport